MHVIIIGTGVVGLTSAWYLARQGVQVTLIDRQPQVARETSFANGGQLSYDFVTPLADPAVLPKLPGWLLNADSPLRFRPRLDPDQWRWCYAFLKACNRRQVAQTTWEMLQLSMHSRQLLDELLAQHELPFKLKRTGKLVMHRTASSLAAAAGGVEYQRSLGSDQRLLNAAECLALEPALAAVASSIAGGIYTPTEATGDCRLFCESLFSMLQGLPNVQLLLGQPILKLVRRGAGITAVRLPDGDVEADAFVIAAGLDSLRLTAPLGLSLPLYGLRGYSLTCALPAGCKRPELSVTDAERKVVYAPLGDELRIAAMVDMGQPGAVVDPKRIAQLKRQALEVFPALELAAASPWAGLRPATPGSKPIIDRAGPLSNLWLNVGHGALGFTLACASAELTASLVTGQPAQIDTAPFRLA
ncbi:D-amino acid dehydrogenase [Pseudomonas sp. LJDD11]|uniref:D-amino acid dehydrogenase n=1 Tax=Pseudomonas sp. LJDD11 TaxID=2931984 RepID=UPI00211D0DDF|nr:D-amino acid dehydrogenase [Pseudomonas sp. LJDD11]MCQ9427265.1 D-amino acid dehydrogenase [Pseudomonas sp. LJDD11]